MTDQELARRVLAYAPAILARRGQTAAQLANRCERVTLYSRLILTLSRRAPMR